MPRQRQRQRRSPQQVPNPLSRRPRHPRRLLPRLSQRHAWRLTHRLQRPLMLRRSKQSLGQPPRQPLAMQPNLLLTRRLPRRHTLRQLWHKHWLRWLAEASGVMQCPPDSVTAAVSCPRSASGCRRSQPPPRRPQLWQEEGGKLQHLLSPTLAAQAVWACHLKPASPSHPPQLGAPAAASVAAAGEGLPRCRALLCARLLKQYQLSLARSLCVCSHPPLCLGWPLTA